LATPYRRAAVVQRGGGRSFLSGRRDHIVPSHTVSAVAKNLAALTQARSLLLLLLATCQQTLLALEAAANDLDTDMTDDLTAMIARSERELEVLDAKIRAAGG
jgi:hypothetical protein